MESLSDRSPHLNVSRPVVRLASPTPSSFPLKTLGAELAFIQDRRGCYVAFDWQLAIDYKVASEDIVGQSFYHCFIPDSPYSYEQRLQRVLSRRIPEQFYALFHYRDQNFPFELVMSPILTKVGVPTTVLVMGHLIQAPNPQCSPLPPQPESYQALLTQIARKIRSTLNLETIWQQTADSIGEALQVSRCLMITSDPQGNFLDVKGEYSKQKLSLLGRRWKSQDESFWQQALQQREPIVVEGVNTGQMAARSMLIVSTVYQNQCNGLICLQQCDRDRTWSQGELELIQELAEQVGTAIAHATLCLELGQATLAAEEASRLKSEFLASTTHELRTPLNGIIGFLKLILDGMADDAEEQQQFLEESHKSALHLLHLINDILDIAKIEAGKMDLEFSAVPLNELFQSVEGFTRPQAHGKNLNFKIKSLPTLTPIVVYGNYQRLLQVMLNLVGNAIKFTHEGGIVISAEIIKKRIHFQDQTFPGMVKVSVADTGIGVSLDKQAKLFEKFVQIDGSHTKAYGGTGLGLAISQKLVEAMGGKVKFYSMGEGLGSTVTFTVPLERLPIVETQVNSE